MRNTYPQYIVETLLNRGQSLKRSLVNSRKKAYQIIKLGGAGGQVSEAVQHKHQHHQREVYHVADEVVSDVLILFLPVVKQYL